MNGERLTMKKTIIIIFGLFSISCVSSYSNNVINNNDNKVVDLVVITNSGDQVINFENMEIIGVPDEYKISILDGVIKQKNKIFDQARIILKAESSNLSVSFGLQINNWYYLGGISKNNVITRSSIENLLVNNKIIELKDSQRDVYEFIYDYKDKRIFEYTSTGKIGDNEVLLTITFNGDIVMLSILKLIT
jgi:hypothetical protein